MQMGASTSPLRQHRGTELFKGEIHKSAGVELSLWLSTWELLAVFNSVCVCVCVYI